MKHRWVTSDISEAERIIKTLKNACEVPDGRHFVGFGGDSYEIVDVQYVKVTFEFEGCVKKLGSSGGEVSE